MVTREELEALQKDPLSKEKALEYQQKQEALARANELNNMSPVERWVSRFPFIIKNWKRKKLAYDWDVDYIADTVSPQHALQWYKENHKHIKDFKFNCFWDDEIFQLPVVAELEDISTLYPIKPNNIEKECKDITTEFIKVLWLLTSNRILKEKNFKIRQQLLQHYKLYEIEQPFPIFNIHFFVFDKPTSDQTLISASSSTASNSNTNLTPAEMEANNINKSNIAKQYWYVKEAQSFTHISRMTLQQIQELCAMKEFLEGKIKFKSFKLKGNVINNPYSNVTLNSLASLFNQPNQPNNNEPNNDNQAPLLCWHYTSSIRYAMFWEEKYYKRIRPWQTLQPRQWIAKLHTGWVTSVVAPRRWGKTYRAIDEAVEMFTRDSQERSKPVRVLFVGINNKKLQTAIKYLLSFTKQFTEAWYFERESSKNIMHYRQSDSKAWKSKSIQDLWTIEFIWSKDDDAWVWDYADLIIIDECERIAENVWEDIMPIITNEGARCILISTLNKNSQKTWFYNQLIQWETEEIQRWLTNMDVVEVIKQQWNKRVQPHIDEAKKTWKPFEEWINDIDIDAMAAEMRYLRQWVWIRFTGEDNDLKTEQEKTFARDRLRWTKAYYPEWWGIFPEDVWVYDYESSIKEKDYFNNRKYKYTVLAYDPAESRDKAALVYMWRDPNINKIEIFKTEKLPNNYTYHWPAIKKALSDCKQYIDLSQSTTASTNAEVDRYRQNTTTPVNPEMRTFFAYDYNWVWQGLEPFLQESWVRIDMKVRFTWQWWIVRKGNEHRVPKNLLVSNMQNMLDHNWTIINQECLELIEEMDHYKWYYNADTGYTKYQAEAWASDDFVSATMIWSYFILEYMGEKYNISKNDIALDDYAPTIEDRYHDFERTIMEWLNSWKSVKDMMAEFNWEKQRHSLKRSDILSQFWY